MDKYQFPKSRKYSATEARQTARMAQRKTPKAVYLLTSGPMMALAGAGLACLFAPAESFTAPYSMLFQEASQKVWGVLSLSAATMGYIGLFTNRHQLWAIAHGFGVFLFVLVAIFFLQSRSYTGAATYAALAANSWARSTALYREPFCRG